MQELQEAKKRLFRYDPNLYLVGLNAYKMPFKDNSIDYILSVRLAHHIRYLDIFAKETFRVLKPGGILILEAAHKNHIKAIFRALIKRNYSFFKKKFIRVEHNPQESQGIKDSDGQIPIMFNFSASFVIKTFTQKVGFDLKGVYPCSFFRIRALKKVVPLRILLGLEKLLQHFSFLKFTPSLFYVFYKPRATSRTKSVESKSFIDLLQCPDKRKLSFEQNKILCDNKSTAMSKIGERLFDIRDPRPDKIKF